MNINNDQRTLRIAGYAALFDVIDAARDIIVRGAFSRTLSQRIEGIPLYWQHRAYQRIGMVDSAEEDDRGLRIIASIDDLYGKAANALRSQTVNGLSFGFKPRIFRLLPAGRLLEDIDLFEVSLVTYPVQSEARVHLIQ